MKTISNYPDKFYLGKSGGERIYLTAPSWDCGWYWGFGYLGNKNCHYHVDGLSKNSDLFDGFKKHFGDTFIIKNDSDIWLLSELFETFYHFKKFAEVYHIGGSNYTNNPLKEIIKNGAELKRINEVILPHVFEEIYKVLNKYKSK